MNMEHKQTVAPVAYLYVEFHIFELFTHHIKLILLPWCILCLHFPPMYFLLARGKMSV